MFMHFPLSKVHSPNGLVRQTDEMERLALSLPMCFRLFYTANKPEPLVVFPKMHEFEGWRTRKQPTNTRVQLAYLLKPKAKS